MAVSSSELDVISSMKDELLKKNKHSYSFLFCSDCHWKEFSHSLQGVSDTMLMFGSYSPHTLTGAIVASLKLWENADCALYLKIPLAYALYSPSRRAAQG